MIVFSRFLFGERPRVCFYSVEQEREVVEYHGASMLLHISPISDSITGHTEHGLLLYTNPVYCQDVIEDEDGIVDLLEEQRYSNAEE